MKINFKIGFSVVALLFSAATMNAEVLSPADALARAMGPGMPLKGLSTNKTDAKLLMTQTTGDKPSVYVFSNGTANTLVVSADDVAPALLGYTDVAVTDKSDLPPALLYWIEDYGQQIDYARHAGAPARVVGFVNADELSPIGPLVTTKWNQDAPYNNMAPQVGSSTCYTGCVATAFAQVLNYHEWPAKGVGTHSYTWNSTTLSFDYANTTFDWANMLDSYEGTSTDEQKNAVATLMYAAGVSVDMSYGTSSSGAVTREVGKALQTYFDYDPCVSYFQRSYYSSKEWNQAVYDQLKNYGPVIFSGRNSSGGHAFVCDGYGSDGYFHINWGWGGQSDGFFLLTALDPQTQGIGGSTAGYNQNAAMIGNIRPNRTGTTTESPSSLVCNGFVISKSDDDSTTNIPLGSLMKNAYGEYNNGYNTISNYGPGAKLVAEDGTVTYCNEYSTRTSLDPDYFYYSYNFYLPSTLADGTYSISPAYRDSDGKWHDMVIPKGAPYTGQLVVTDGIVSLVTTPGANLVVTDFKAASELYLGRTVKITANVQNTGGSEFYGRLQLILAREETNNSLTSVGGMNAVNVSIEPGQTLPLTLENAFGYFSGQTLTAGEYIMILYDVENSQIIANTTITLQDTPAAGSITLTNVQVRENDSAVNKHKIHITAEVTASGYVAGALNVYFFPYTTGTVSSLASFTSEVMYLQDGETYKLNMICDFASGEDGKKYFLNFHDGSSWVGNQDIFTLESNPGAGINSTTVANAGDMWRAFTYSDQAVSNCGGDMSQIPYILKGNVLTHTNYNGDLVIEKAFDGFTHCNSTNIPFTVSNGVATCALPKRIWDYYIGTTSDNIHLTVESAFYILDDLGNNTYNVLIPLGNNGIFSTDDWKGTVTEQTDGTYRIEMPAFGVGKVMINPNVVGFYKYANDYSTLIGAVYGKPCLIENQKTDYLANGSAIFSTYKPTNSITDHITDVESGAEADRKYSVGVTMADGKISIDNWSNLGRPNLITHASTSASDKWLTKYGKYEGTYTLDDLTVLMSSTPIMAVPNQYDTDYLYERVMTTSVETVDDDYQYGKIKGQIQGTPGHIGANTWLNGTTKKTVIVNPEIAFENYYLYDVAYGASTPLVQKGIISNTVLPIAGPIEYTHSVEMDNDVSIVYQANHPSENQDVLWVKGSVKSSSIKNYGYVDHYELHIMPGTFTDADASEFDNADKGHDNGLNISDNKFYTGYHPGNESVATLSEGGDDQPISNDANANGSFCRLIRQSDFEDAGIEMSPDNVYTLYLKAVYTTESGLAPSYHALTALSGTTTGVDAIEVDGDGATITLNGNTLTIVGSNGDAIVVTPTGAVVWQGGDTTVQLAPGLYIARAGKTTKRFVVD